MMHVFSCLLTITDTERHRHRHIETETRRFRNSVVIRKGSTVAEAVVQTAVDAGVEEVYGSCGCEPSGLLAGVFF